ncbi:MAG: DUF1553 domain-containing protein [Acidimicrobiia bacterium]|nr:DUF1553 domain-containing protein [Acidimicrobiia bacterium]
MQSCRRQLFSIPAHARGLSLGWSFLSRAVALSLLAGTTAFSQSSAGKTSPTGPKPALQKITVYPSSIVLGSSRASQQLVVEGTYADGYSEDLTAKALMQVESRSTVRIEGDRVLPVASGAGTILASVGALKTSVAVSARDIEQRPEWSFRNHVVPVLTKTGCNMGACHGAAAGKNGFKLTLRGYDPLADYLVLTREAVGRRVTAREPGRSLVLLKPTLLVPHAGGRRFGVDSREYQVISQWIAEGIKPPQDGDRRIEGIRIEPALVKLRPGTRQQLVVTAVFNDGYMEDVTSWVRFESTNAGTASVDDRGLVELKGSGEASITAMFLSKVAVATLVVPFQQQISRDRFEQAPRANYIDKLALAKLEILNLEPSGPCTDGEFIRRAYLDTTGTLPSIDAVKEFLHSGNRDKRQALIERLLASEAYVDYWSYKWADLLLLSDNKATSGNKKLNPAAVRSFYNWIRASVQENKPWDKMVRELLTSTGSSRENGALNFYQIHKDPIRVTENTTVAFMGLRLTCARCHNHPLEKWTQVDYYKMANLFARVRQKAGDTPGEIVVVNAVSGDIDHPRLNKALPPAPLDGEEIALDSPQERRQILANWLTSPQNRSFSRTIVNRVWANFMGRGLADPVDDIRSTNPPSNEPLMNALVEDFVKNGYDLKHLCRVILTSATYQRSWKTTPANVNDDRYFSHYQARRLPAEVILDAVSQVTQVPTDFSGFPKGTRALQLPDTSVDSYFLDAFGRPQRAATCACEREAQPNLRQALHVINGETINQKLSSQDGWIAAALKRNLPNPEVVEALYLASYSRYPTESEHSEAVRSLEAASAGKGPKVRQEALEDFAWAMLTSKEFVFNH